MFRIKKDDQVIVIAGKDKGKTGKVLKVFLIRLNTTCIYVYNRINNNQNLH